MARKTKTKSSVLLDLSADVLAALTRLAELAERHPRLFARYGELVDAVGWLADAADEVVAVYPNHDEQPYVARRARVLRDMVRPILGEGGEPK